jgi:hypothetical protein
MLSVEGLVALQKKNATYGGALVIEKGDFKGAVP